jgi:hypothetical protein
MSTTNPLIFRVDRETCGFFRDIAGLEFLPGRPRTVTLDCNYSPAIPGLDQPISALTDFPLERPRHPRAFQTVVEEGGAIVAYLSGYVIPLRLNESPKRFFHRLDCIDQTLADFGHLASREEWWELFERRSILYVDLIESKLPGYGAALLRHHLLAASQLRGAWRAALKVGPLQYEWAAEADPQENEGRRGSPVSAEEYEKSRNRLGAYWLRQIPECGRCPTLLYRTEHGVEKWIVAGLPKDRAEWRGWVTGWLDQNVCHAAG